MKKVNENLDNFVGKCVSSTKRSESFQISTFIYIGIYDYVSAFYCLRKRVRRRKRRKMKQRKKEEQEKMNEILHV